MQKLVDLCAALVLTLTVLAGAVTLTLACRPLYYYDIGKLQIEESSGYEEKEIRENYDALIDYSLSPFRSKLEFPTFPMSEEAEIHFAEVKRIFQFFLWAFVIGLPVSAALVVFFRRRGRYGFLKLGAVLTIALPVVPGSLIALNWDHAFTLFHEVMFDNDYWIFDSVTDPVITILPDAYFLHCAVLILVLTLVGSGVLLALRNCLTNNTIRRIMLHRK